MNWTLIYFILIFKIYFRFIIILNFIFKIEYLLSQIWNMKTWLKDGKTLKKRFGAGLAVAHGFGGALSAVHYSMEIKKQYVLQNTWMHFAHWFDLFLTYMQRNNVLWSELFPRGPTPTLMAEFSLVDLLFMWWVFIW